MKLFYQEPKPDAQKIHDTVSKAYGIKYPEHINGYIGTFLFHIPDVYVTDKIAKKMEVNPKIADELNEMLDRFCKCDFGFVTDDEEFCNIEKRYISFSSSWMVGRYSGTILHGVVFETLYDFSIFYLPEENITEDVNKQYIKMCHVEHYTIKPVMNCRNNQMCYKNP